MTDDRKDRITRCPDCDGQVSKAASTCPHCGRPMNDNVDRVHTSNDSLLTRQRGCGDFVLYGGIAAVVLMFLFLRGCTL